jgi:hypothetical protein
MTALKNIGTAHGDNAINPLSTKRLAFTPAYDSFTVPHKNDFYLKVDACFAHGTFSYRPVNSRRLIYHLN